jgi:hypothetical protein
MRPGFVEWFLHAGVAEVGTGSTIGTYGLGLWGLAQAARHMRPGFVGAGGSSQCTWDEETGKGWRVEGRLHAASQMCQMP